MPRHLREPPEKQGGVPADAERPTDPMVGYTGFKTNVIRPEPLQKEMLPRGTADQRFVPGYSGFVPKIVSGNNFGKGFGPTTNNFFKDQLPPYGAKDRPLDNQNPKDKFTSINDVLYQDDKKTEHDKLVKFRPRPASAA